MKYFATVILLFSFSLTQSQSLPIDFESTITTADFIDFDGGSAAVIANPEAGEINTSATVGQIVRDGGQVWAGSKLTLAANLDFATMNSITMKVFTTAPVGTVVKFKLEGNGTTERDMPTTVTNQWELITWDFTGEPANFNTIALMFDFGNVGNGSTNSTFLFDDIEQKFGGTQIDWPVNFESTTVNYAMTDFGGNVSSLVVDPTNSTNGVIQVIKANDAATWAGTTIGTPAGFATNIPLTLTESKMTVRVWSPSVGTPIRLKVEDSKDPTHTCETEVNTTVAGDWEILEFDFANQAPGTELLSIGLDRGWIYNMTSIFFNFGTDGATAGEITFYFDDVSYGEAVLGTENYDLAGLDIFPNPSSTKWTIRSLETMINSIELFDVQGQLVLVQTPNKHVTQIDASGLAKGVHVAKISTTSGMQMIRLLKE